MDKSWDINHVHGLYRSVCCGVERSLASNSKFPPCLGSSKSGGSPCVKNVNWTLVRPTQMINR